MLSMHYLNTNNLLSSSQHGIRPRQSTETALAFASDSILSATDQRDISFICLIDLSICFDLIDHEKLIKKLQLLEVDIAWLKNYINVHTQSVSITGSDGRICTFSRLTINQGVFQGSSLGPVLFCVFANDLTLSLYAGDAQAVQYADDTLRSLFQAQNQRY